MSEVTFSRVRVYFIFDDKRQRHYTEIASIVWLQKQVSRTVLKNEFRHIQVPAKMRGTTEPAYSYIVI